MKIPEDEEQDLTAAQKATEQKMLAFLDELTQLTRRYSIVISSEGNIDVPSLRAMDPALAATSAYRPFWRGQFSYPLDFIIEDQTQHLIDM